MPNINEFINKPEPIKNTMYEELGGVRGCASCDLDVEGALWDPNEKILVWECNNGHKNKFQVQ